MLCIVKRRVKWTNLLLLKTGTRNTNPHIDKSDDESKSEATATVSKRQNSSGNASQAKQINMKTVTLTLAS